MHQGRSGGIASFFSYFKARTNNLQFLFNAKDDLRACATLTRIL